MKYLLKELIKKTPLFTPLRNWAEKRRQKKELVEWERNGKPAPSPHIIKQRNLKEFTSKYQLKILVETGTYYGDMVEAMKGTFDQIYSIELSEKLYEKAKKRFKKEKTIELIQGDSGAKLANLIDKIDKPTLFWLDGHYSAGITAQGDKDTPIYAELTHIFNAQDTGHVIIIDDARCFGTDPAYTSIEELRQFILSKNSNASITIEDDSIRITSKHC